MGLLMPPDAPLHIYASPIYYTLDQVAQIAKALFVFGRDVWSDGTAPPGGPNLPAGHKGRDSSLSAPRGGAGGAIIEEIFCGPRGRRNKTRGEGRAGRTRPGNVCVLFCLLYTFLFFPLFHSLLANLGEIGRSH